MRKFSLCLATLLLCNCCDTVFSAAFNTGDFYLSKPTSVLAVDDDNPAANSVFIPWLTLGKHRMTFGYTDGYPDSMFLVDDNKISQYGSTGQFIQSWNIGSTSFGKVDIKAQISSGNTEYIYYLSSMDIIKLNINSGEKTSVRLQDYYWSDGALLFEINEPGYTDTDYIWASRPSASEIVKVNLSTGQIVQSLQKSYHLGSVYGMDFGYNEDGTTNNYLYALSDNGWVLKFDITTGARVAQTYLGYYFRDLVTESNSFGATENIVVLQSNTNTSGSYNKLYKLDPDDLSIKSIVTNGSVFSYTGVHVNSMEYVPYGWDGFGQYIDPDPTAIPEPCTIALIGLALLFRVSQKTRNCNNA